MFARAGRRCVAEKSRSRFQEDTGNLDLSVMRMTDAGNTMLDGIDSLHCPSQVGSGPYAVLNSDMRITILRGWRTPFAFGEAPL